MSIFKRQGEGQQAGTATATMTEVVPQGLPPVPPAAGVVPPAAAPIYTTRPTEPPTDAGDTSVTEKLRAAREALENARVSVEGSVRVNAQRSRATVASRTAARRAQQQPPQAQQAAPARPRVAGGQRGFDPVACAQAGLLNLAWRWQEAGAPIRAIHAYMELLSRYPDSAAAAAAVADLVELSEKLAGEGQFHTALAIYDRLEQLQ